MNNKVDILDGSDLSFKSRLEHPSMTRPVCVILTKQEIYVLTRGGTDCIHVFTYAHVRLRSLIRKVERANEIHKAFFFCVDPHNDNIIIHD